MINEEQLVAAAQQAAGEPVVAKAECRRHRAGEILSERGLLAATRSALVFVVDDLLRAGPATVWRTSELRGHEERSELFSATLRLQTSHGHVELSDLRAELIPTLLKACGLASSAPEPTSLSEPEAVDAAEPTPFQPEILTSAPTPRIVSQPPDEAPKSSPAQNEPLLFLSAPVFAASVQAVSPFSVLDDESVVETSASADPRNRATSDGIDLGFAPKADTATKPMEKSDNSNEDSDDDSDEDSDDESDDDSDDDSDDKSDDKSDSNSSDSAAKELLAASDSVTPPPTTETPAEAKPETKAPPEAVSDWLGLGMLMLLIAAFALPVLVHGNQNHSYWGLFQPSQVLTALGDWGGTLVAGFFVAAGVTVVGAPATALGCRPTVFWTTLPLWLAALGVLFGLKHALSSPNLAALATPEDLLLRLRLVATTPLVVAALAAYVYGLPLLGVWFRALATGPGRGKASDSEYQMQSGNSSLPIFMLANATLTPLAALLYVHRSQHAPWAILIALAFVAPSALLAWQGSRLDPRVKWDLGGSPAAFVVQAAVGYALYWLVVRQLGIVAQLDGVMELPPHTLASDTVLDDLMTALGSNDLQLAKGLGLSLLGVLVAAHAGHSAICATAPDQKRSGLGWLLALTMLALLALITEGITSELRPELGKLIELIRTAAARS